MSDLTDMEISLPIRCSNATIPKQTIQGTEISHWSVEDVAAEVLSLYLFLVRTYIPEQFLAIPGPEGWSYLTPHESWPFAKNGRVLALLRQLPYLQNQLWDLHDKAIWADCICIDHRGGGGYPVPKAAHGPSSQAMLKSHQLPLARNKANTEFSLVFDTHTGQVQYDSHTRGITETFEDMATLVRRIKTDFMTLKLLAVDYLRVLTPDDTPYELYKLLHDVYSRHNWPGEDYSRAACLEETLRVETEYWELQERNGMTDIPSLWTNHRRNARILDERVAAEAISTAEAQECLPYSVEHVAAQLLSLYQFLIRMYAPADMLKIPPKSGWPEITTESFKSVRKHDRAIDLLRHLPYMNEEVMIWGVCTCRDWTGPEMLNAAAEGDHNGEGGLLDPLPPTSVLLGTAVGRDGFSIIFDTLTGRLERLNAMHGEEKEFSNIDEYVESMKDDFISLRILPINDHEVREEAMNGDGVEYGMRKAVFAKHGWPTDDYDKAACLEEVQRTRFP